MIWLLKHWFKSPKQKAIKHLFECFLKCPFFINCIIFPWFLITVLAWKFGIWYFWGQSPIHLFGIRYLVFQIWSLIHLFGIWYFGGRDFLAWTTNLRRRRDFFEVFCYWPREKMVFRFSIWVLIFRFSSPIHLFGIWYLKIGGLIYLVFGIGTSKSLFIQQKYQIFMPVQ